ncbi:MAG: protein translocase SEC61 complex subunit gamma [Candidatus Bathyarchaeota archaeon]|nr:protein translocase SEC61 complex subunit gamma [Candidatus Bathyarchaeota archaeon]
MFNLSLRSFLSQCKRLLRLSKKPTRREIWLFIKILLIGLAIIGITGFVIRLISSMFMGFIPRA